MARRLHRGPAARAAYLIAGLLPVSAAAAFGQEAPSQAPRAVFEESVHVKVVNVQVFVRDKDGNPVTGLTREDFILREQKDPVTITNFYEVHERVKVGDVPGLVPDDPEIRFVDRPGLERRRRVVPEDERLHLVIYIDHMNIRPQNRNRVFRYVREFLRKDVTRDDRVMLLSYNRSVKVERDFTSDPQMIANALYDLEKHTGGRTQWDSDRADIIRDIGEEDRFYEYVQGRVRIYSQSIYNDMQFTLDGLKDSVISLAGLPGRKAFMYVSDGLPMRAGADLWEALDQRGRAVDSLSYNQNSYLDSLQYDSSRRFSDLVDTANANEVSFYTVVAAGPMGINSRDASMQGMAFTSNIDSVARDNVHSSVMYMADETGGQYIVNTNNFRDGLNRIALDFTSYYSLGFQPGARGHRPEVQAGGRVDERGEAAAGTEGPARAAPPELPRQVDRHGDDGGDAGRAQAGLREERPGDLPGQEGGDSPRRAGALHGPCRRAGADRRDDAGAGGHGRRSPPAGAGVGCRPWRRTATFRRPRSSRSNSRSRPADLDRARESYYTYTLPLIMKEGDQRLTIAVRDDVAGQTSFITRTLRVGA